MDFRHEVIVRRTKFELDKAQKRAHILEGLLKAIDIIDEIIRVIRSSKNPSEAKANLMESFGFSDEQAAAIVAMRLGQLTGLEREKLKAEYDELEKFIAHCIDILGSEQMQLDIIKEETQDIKNRFADPRRTEIVPSADEFNPEDFYADDDVVITISHLGYIKRTLLTEFKTQNRGGVGLKASATKDDDFIEHIYVANMHSTLLFFTESGRLYWLKVYQIPEGARASKGRAIQNVLNIPDDKIRAILNVRNLDDREFVENNYVVLSTKRGLVKKTTLEAYSRPRANGINAINIREDDQLLDAVLTTGRDQLLIAAMNGRCCRFEESDARPLGRTAAGVRGINIEDDDEVVGTIAYSPDAEDAADHTVLVVSENGYGKRTDFDEYRITNRGGKGVRTLDITEKTGKLVAIKNVTDNDDLMIINRSGLTIRMAVSDIRVAHRATQGVRLINLREGDAIASISVVSKSEESPAEANAENAADAGNVENTATE